MSPLSFFAVTTYFYPRPPRGGRLDCETANSKPEIISIHALREEGDERKRDTLIEHIKISIHALREEDDPRAKDGPHQLFQFLSTPSARRATQGYPMHGRIL